MCVFQTGVMAEVNAVYEETDFGDHYRQMGFEIKLVSKFGLKFACGALCTRVPWGLLASSIGFSREPGILQERDHPL